METLMKTRAFKSPPGGSRRLPVQEASRRDTPRSNLPVIWFDPWDDTSSRSVLFSLPTSGEAAVFDVQHTIVDWQSAR
jgi:hypothetical protein